MRDVLILATILGLVPFILRRAWIGVLAWTWIGLMNPHLYSWRATSFPVAMIIGGATLLALVYTRERRMVPLTAPMALTALLAVFFAIKTPFAWAQPEAWWQLDKVLKILLMTFVATMLIHGETRVRWFIVVILVSLGFYGFKGGIFTLATGGQYRVEAPEGSFIGGNTQLGLALVMCLPLLIAFAQLADRRWARWLGWATVGLSTIAIVFTYSRGALLGLASIAVPLWMMSKRKVLSVAIAVPALAVGLALAPDKLLDRAETIGTYQQDLSALQRLQAWSVARNIAIENPVFGAGFNLDYLPFSTWAPYSDPEFVGPGFDLVRAAHSIYFQMLGEHGFLGLLLYLTLVFCTFVSLNRTRVQARRVPELEWARRYATALMVGLVGYLTAGAFLSLAYFDLFYTYVALAAILAREVAEHGARLQPAAAASPSLHVRPVTHG